MVRRRSGQSRSGDFEVQLVLKAQDLASRVIAKTQSNLEGLGNGLNRVSGVAQKITFLGLAFNQIQAAIAGARASLEGFYQAFIGQNVQLEQQLLQVRAGLASTLDIFQDGVRIDDVGQSLDALAAPLERSLDNVRAKSLDLVGITSDQLLPIYQVLAQESGAIGANFTEIEDLTISFGAALSTLQLPLDFGTVRQEISSILQGSVSIDSTLAKTLGITNAQIAAYREQGILVEQLNQRLAAFVEANAQAAQTIPGVLSNIQEIFLTITREAGAGLDDLIAGDLNRVYEFLTQNADRLQATLTGAIQILVDGTAPLRQSIRDLVVAGADLASALIDGAGGNLQEFATGIVQTLNAAATTVVEVTTTIVRAITSIAESDAGQAAIAVFFDIASVISNVVRGAFELFDSAVDGAAGALGPLGNGINQAIALLQQLAPVVDVIREGFGLFVDVARVAFAQIPNLINAAQQALAPLIGLIAGPFIAALNEAGKIAPTLFSGLQQTIGSVFRAVLGALERFATVISDARQLLRDLGIIQVEVKGRFEAAAEGFDAGTDALSRFGDGAENAAGQITTAQRAVDALQQNVGRASKELERSRLRVDVDQSQQLAQLQQQLTDGLISERDFQDQRNAITSQGLESQLSIVSEKVSQLREQYDALTEVEKQQATESFDEIQKLEQQQAQLQQQVAEQQLQETQRLRDRDRQDLERAQQEANATITAAATQREIDLQELRNQGLLSERELNEELVQVNAERVASQLEQEQQRLEGLRAIRSQIGDSESQEAIQAEQQIAESEQRILDLTKERLTTEQQLQQQAQEAIIREIEKRAQAAQNAATRESQALEGTLRLYDSLNASIEQQANLLQAIQGLKQAENNLATTNLNIAANLTKNERERQRIQTQGAIAQLESLREQQAFEDQSLAIQQELERLALRRRQTEAEIAEIQARAAIASAEAERAKVQAAFERGDANELEVEAANLAVEAAQAGLEAAQQQRGLIDQEVALQPLQQAIARRQQEIDQQAAENQARADVIASLPENSGVRRRLTDGLKDEILSELQIDTARSARDTNALAERAVRGGETNVLAQGRNLESGNQQAELERLRRLQDQGAGGLDPQIQRLEASINEGLAQSADRLLQAGEGLTPQIAGFDAAIAPLTAVQTTGNDFLSQIAANTARPSTPGGVTIQALNVTVAGGNTAGQTGEAIATATRSAIERVLDQALAIQSA